MNQPGGFIPQPPDDDLEVVLPLGDLARMRALLDDLRVHGLRRPTFTEPPPGERRYIDGTWWYHCPDCHKLVRQKRNLGLLHYCQQGTGHDSA